MFSDRQRPARIRAEQDRALRRTLARELYPYGDAHRRRLDGVLTTSTRIRGREDLARVPALALREMGDPVDLVLRPDQHRISRHGHWTARARLAWASVLGRQHHYGRTRIEPVYKPVQWMMAAGVPVGYSNADLDRLAEIGRRWLEAAGVRSTDVLLSLLAAGPDLAHWQLALGARRAGLSAIHLDPEARPADVFALKPEILAGSPETLLQLGIEGRSEGRRFPTVKLVLAVGRPLTEMARSSLAEVFDDAEILVAWAPVGVRALWAECRPGSGAHTWPATELVEVVDPDTGVALTIGEDAEGELVWTGLEWRGTALLRLRTGVVGRVVEGTCPSCGRSNPRVLPPATAELEAALAISPALGSWRLERRPVAAGEELIVHFTADLHGDALETELRDLDARFGITQFVVQS